MIQSSKPLAPNWEVAQLDETLATVLRRVYGWMALGLLVTAGVAAAVSVSPLMGLLAANPALMWGMFLVEIGLVLGISFGIKRLSPQTAVSLFFLYAAVNGVTLAFMFAVYTLGSVAVAFGSTAVLFGTMSIIGYTTKVDLSRFGRFFLFALVGIVIASVINMFWSNSVLSWIVTYVGMFIFLGLTVYHTQRIKRQVAAALAQHDELQLSRISILGALVLYLDFINLFLRLLRITGRRR